MMQNNHEIDVNKMGKRAAAVDRASERREKAQSEQAGSDYEISYQGATGEVKRRLEHVRRVLNEGIESGTDSVLVGEVTTARDWSRSYKGDKLYAPRDQAFLDALTALGLTWKVAEEDGFDMADHKITEHNVYVQVPGRPVPHDWYDSHWAD